MLVPGFEPGVPRRKGPETEDREKLCSNSQTSTTTLKRAYALFSYRWTPSLFLESDRFGLHPVFVQVDAIAFYGEQSVWAPFTVSGQCIPRPIRRTLTLLDFVGQANRRTEVFLSRVFGGSGDSSSPTGIGLHAANGYFFASCRTTTRNWRSQLSGGLGFYRSHACERLTSAQTMMVLYVHQTEYCSHSWHLFLFVLLLYW